MKAIITTQELNEPIVNGGKPIKVGTIFKEYNSYLSWIYYKSDQGQTLLIQGWDFTGTKKIY